VHDSQKLDDILDSSNTGKDVWADSAYRSAAIARRLRENVCGAAGARCAAML
jgi:hypothetical protein